jgi:rhamnulokinase
VLAGPTEATAIGNILAQMIAGGALKNVAEARALVAKSFPLAVYG